jgi:hypothetical protein
MKGNDEPAQPYRIAFAFPQMYAHPSLTSHNVEPRSVLLGNFGPTV